MIGGITRQAVLRAVVGAVASAVMGYVVKLALASWGALDGLSRGMGSWLKIHVTAAEAGWLLAVVTSAALYGVVLWWAGRTKPAAPAPDPLPIPEIIADTGNIRDEELVRRRRLITRVRDLAHDYNTYHTFESFGTFIRRQREYFDIEPFFGTAYRADIADTAAGVTGTGASLECHAFLKEVGRLERLWGLRD